MKNEKKPKAAFALKLEEARTKLELNGRWTMMTIPYVGNSRLEALI